MRNTLKGFLKSQRDRVYFYIPLNWFWNRDIRQNYNLLMKTQYWDYDDLLRLQTTKLQRLLKFVYDYVPFYQRMFEKLRIKPDDIKKIDDLKIFPIIDKTFVNNNYDDFIPKLNFQKLYPASTSGSNGQALVFKWHPNYYHIKVAANYRYCNWAGKGWLDKDVHLGAPLFDLTGAALFKRDYKTKTWNFNTANLDDASLNRIIHAINTIRPDCISGYPSIIYLLANHIINHGIKLNKWPKSILTTSEIVFDEMRENIETAFQTKLYDWYGMIEGCASGGQCEYGNYHINMEYTLIEFVEQDGITKIVGTNLENLAFPLVRYDTGDLGEFVGYDCPCKRGLPIMKLTGGRMKNLIKIPNGNKYMFPNYFPHILKSPIKEFQIIQNRIDSIDLFIVKRDDFTKEDLNKINYHLGKYLGNNITVNVNFVNNIKRGPRGKYEMVISNL